MQLCPSCFLPGYCRKEKSAVVTDKEMTPAFVQDGRNFARKLTIEQGISAGQWPHRLVSWYRDYSGRVIDNATGNETYLDTEALFGAAESDVEDLDAWESHYPNRLVEPERESRTWFRDNLTRACGPSPRIVHRARLRVVLTILRACYPQAAQVWGLRAANDND